MAFNANSTKDTVDQVEPSPAVESQKIKREALPFHNSERVFKLQGYLSGMSTNSNSTKDTMDQASHETKKMKRGMPMETDSTEDKEDQVEPEVTTESQKIKRKSR